MSLLASDLGFVMGTSAHSDDLRARVVGEVLSGASRRQAAARFKVSVSSAIRWTRLQAQTGGVSPRARGGRSRSPLEPHADWLLALLVAEPDLTLQEIVERVLAGPGVASSEASIRRFFGRHKISFKKNSARGRTGPARRRRGATEMEGRPSQP